MIYKKSLTAAEIKAIYSAVYEGEKAVYVGERYKESIPLKYAVLAGFKGLFAAYGYGYYYGSEYGEENVVDENVVVPLALNYIFGTEEPKNDENRVLVTIDRREKGVLLFEDLFDGTPFEITVEEFAELFDGKEFSEDNVSLIRPYYSSN